MNFYSSIIKKIALALLLLLSRSEFGFTQNPSVSDSLLNNAIHLFENSDEKKALDSFKKVLKHDKNNFQALWHISLLYARVGYRYESTQEMMENYGKALQYAEKALELYPERGHSHFVYAVANGRISDISDTKTRINKSHIVKKHAEKAVELLPDYAPAWHLLALWHSKVANISGVKQFAARFFSEGIPEGASNQKAVEYIEKAIMLNPDQTLRYKVDLARHYNRAGEKQKAVQTLNEALEIKPENYIDEWNLGRARDLLNDLS